MGSSSVSLSSRAEMVPNLCGCSPLIRGAAEMKPGVCFLQKHTSQRAENLETGQALWVLLQRAELTQHLLVHPKVAAMCHAWRRGHAP